jgi:hypothetical protein
LESKATSCGCDGCLGQCCIWGLEGHQLNIALISLLPSPASSVHFEEERMARGGIMSIEVSIN